MLHLSLGRCKDSKRLPLGFLVGNEHLYTCGKSLLLVVQDCSVPFQSKAHKKNPDKVNSHY